MSAAATPQQPQQPQQLRTRITYRQDQTQAVRVEGPGVEQAGVKGLEYRYTLAGHGIMWVPPAVHAAIQAATAGHYPADFEITKRRGDQWETVHVIDAPAAPPPAARPNATERALAAITAPPAQPNLPGTTTAEPYSGSMYTALCAAIRTAAAAETFARSIGRAVAFQTGDIRAIAATLFIHAQEGR
jgi:hypothetical protein